MIFFLVLRNNSGFIFVWLIHTKENITNPCLIHIYCKIMYISKRDVYITYIIVIFLVSLCFKEYCFLIGEMRVMNIHVNEEINVE